MRRPSPGRANKFSMITAPPIRIGNCRPIRVTTGMRAFLRAWRTITTCLFEPLGPGGADVVLPQHLQRHGAHHPHGGSRGGRPQNQAGDEEPPEISQRVFGERDVFQRRGPAPPDGRIDQYHDGQPEVRRGQADDGDRASQVVGRRILAYRRVDAHRQRDHEPDQDGQQAKLNGDRQSGEYFLLYRPIAPQ